MVPHGGFRNRESGADLLVRESSAYQQRDLTFAIGEPFSFAIFGRIRRESLVKERFRGCPLYPQSATMNLSDGLQNLLGGGTLATTPRAPS